MPDLPLVLTVEEAAKTLRISRGSAYEAIRTNEIPHVRIGRTIRIPRGALLALLGDDLANTCAVPSLLTQEVERDGRRGGADGKEGEAA